MNQLDLVLILLAGLAAVGGYRRGLIVRLLSWVGSLIGMGLGLWLLPSVIDAMSTSAPQSRLLTGLVVFVIAAGVGSALGDVAGQRLRAKTRTTPADPVDRSLGAVAGVASVAVALWLLTPAASEVPGFSRLVRQSAILGVIDDATPRPPDTVTALRNVIGNSRFPQVFEDLRPSPELGPPPESFAMSQAVIDRVTASTVNVESFGCGSRFEGSGFTVEPGIVITNAHVVAGAEDLRVRRPDGSLRDASVIAFNKDRDLAVLAVDRLEQEALQIFEAVVGTDGATVGYPGGQDTPRPTPARIQDDREVLGRDIYGRDRTTRRVLFISANLRQGDSGSPLVDVEGRVVGVVFAIAPDDPDLAYALHTDELRAILAAPRQPGSQGPCS